MYTIYFIKKKFFLIIKYFIDYSNFSFFNSDYNSWGCKKFIKKSDINLKNEKTLQSLLEDNKLIIDTYIILYEYNKGR